MQKPNPKVDGYLRKSKEWQEELRKLREIVLDSPLTEDVKWRAPCYTYGDNNVLMIGRFKECCVLSFLKGALLKDPKGILVKPGENTQSARVIRFTSVEQIEKLRSTLKAYVHEAVEVEKAGLTFTFKKVTEFAVPEELQKKLDEDPRFKSAFEALTPGRQRGYIMHFSAAKQSKTRSSRIEKCAPRIFEGKGMHDD